MALRLHGNRLTRLLKISLAGLLTTLPGHLILAAGVVWYAWPRHPKVIVEELRVRALNLRFPSGDQKTVELDLNASLRVVLINPNVIDVDLHECGAENLYRGVTLGVGTVRAVRHPRKSGVKMDIPAILYTARALPLGPQLLQDVTRRRVPIVCLTRVPGTAYVLAIKVPITIHVRIDLILDPVGMSILSQQSSAKLECLGIPPLGNGKVSGHPSRIPYGVEIK